MGVPAALLTTVLVSTHTEAALPGTLVTATVKAALAFAAGQGATTGVNSAKVAALTQGALRAMFASKPKMAVAVLLTVGSIAAGAGLLACQVLAEKPAQVEKQPEPESVASAPPAQINSSSIRPAGMSKPTGAWKGGSQADQTKTAAISQTSVPRAASSDY
jgi:hypothetical protein